jgi:hypothetical protein
MGGQHHRDRVRRLAAHLTRLDDRGLSRRWAHLLGPLVGISSKAMIEAPDTAELDAAREEADALREENAALRARIEALLRTVDDLARR